MYPQQGFIHDFMYRTSTLEPPDEFRFWAAASLVAAALKRNVYLPSTGDPLRKGFASRDVYPNMFVILVSPPSIGRKSTILEETARIARSVPAINLIQQHVTPPKLVQQMKNFTWVDSGMTFADESAYLNHSELGTLVSRASYKEEMLPLLNLLYDGKPTGQMTIARHVEELKTPSLNLISGVNPKGLATQVPEQFFGAGFASRSIMCYVESTNRRFAYNYEPPGCKTEADLVTNIENIARQGGTATEDLTAVNWYTHWYEQVHDPDPHGELADYYNRKPAHLRKLALVLCCSEGTSTVMDTHYDQALQILTATEREMGHALSLVGVGFKGGLVTFLRQTTRGLKRAKRKDLIKRASQRMSAREFDEALETLIRSEEAKVEDEYITWLG